MIGITAKDARREGKVASHDKYGLCLCPCGESPHGQEQKQCYTEMV
jgi:hypothetical protein